MVTDIAPHKNGPRFVAPSGPSRLCLNHCRRMREELHCRLAFTLNAYVPTYLAFRLRISTLHCAIVCRSEAAANDSRRTIKPVGKRSKGALARWCGVWMGPASGAAMRDVCIGVEADVAHGRP